jgi:hypothetical protein
VVQASEHGAGQSVSLLLPQSAEYIECMPNIFCMSVGVNWRGSAAECGMLNVSF